MTTEPMCCGTPMLHNSWTCEYECADAYFRLIDDGVLDTNLPFLTVEVEDLTTYQRERYEHWRAVRIPAAERSLWERPFPEYATSKPKD